MGAETDHTLVTLCLPAGQPGHSPGAGMAPTPGHSASEDRPVSVPAEPAQNARQD